MSKIDETLKKIAAATTKANSPTSSNAEANQASSGRAIHNMPGDPNCPLCGGIGYLRMDVPVGHPLFGQLEICTCRQPQVSQAIYNRLYAMSNLEELRHLTFESFKPRGHIGLPPFQADSLERAYNQSRQFAQSLNGWLLLQGQVGCGKTHLAAAIANFAVGMGVPTLFITVPDMLDALRSAYGDPQATFDERFDEIRQVQLLILDDFGTQNATPWAQEKLFQILNYRYINHLSLVVTTNLAVGEIEERIRSRFQDPELVTRVQIQAPDYRNPTHDTVLSEPSSLGYLPTNRTFASFDSRRGEKLTQEELEVLENIFQAAREFAEHPHGWIVLLGNENCGKTHLAAAIANYRAELGLPYMYVSVPDLLNHLRASFSPNSGITFDQRFEAVRTSPLLILEDLGMQSSTPWAREQLYALFNYRYNAELPTVITSADKLEEIDPRLRSRMFDRRLCTIYALDVPAYTGGKGSRAKRSTRQKRI
jgi:DNA replication protein DnaC